MPRAASWPIAFNVLFFSKGKGTLICGVGRPIIVVTEGDTGLSKGGTGDILTGVIASLLAQHLDRR